MASGSPLQSREFCRVLQGGVGDRRGKAQRHPGDFWSEPRCGAGRIRRTRSNLFRLPADEVNFVQLFGSHGKVNPRRWDRPRSRMKGNAMRSSHKKLALTGSVAALLLAIPVSIDLGRTSGPEFEFQRGRHRTDDRHRAGAGRSPGDAGERGRREPAHDAAHGQPDHARRQAGAMSGRWPPAPSSPAPRWRWERASRRCRRNAPPSSLTGSRITAAGRPTIARRAAPTWW